MNFFKTMLRMNTVCLGKVSGSGFLGCYIGLAKKGDKKALMFFGTSLKEDYVFTKEDIREIRVIGGVREKNVKNVLTTMMKYELIFKDGKTAICSVDSNGAFQSNFEARIY